jgi:protein phosphatase
MPTCLACGAINRSNARFCYQCSAPLRAERPSSDDAAWLAATLADRPASYGPAASDSNTAPEAQRKENVMDQLDPALAPLFAGRYEITSERDGVVEAIDRRPWTRCWACGTTTNEVGELFCTECGASLDGRRYYGQLLRADEPTGLALVATIADEAVRAVLPPIWDQARDGDDLLTLVAETNRAPVTPPLDELGALRIGLGLARLLDALHQGGLALGTVTPDDVELTASGAPQLRAAPGLHRMSDPPAEAAADLRALAGLLEALTATPRTTQRLEDEQAELAAEPVLTPLLRALRTGEIATAADLAARLEDLVAERTQPAPLWVRVGALSHAGMVRELDEDSLLTLDLRTVQNARGRSWGLYIVADGMGGHAAGEVASGLAIRGAAEMVLGDYLRPTLEADLPDEEERLKALVRAAILQGNEYVVREAHARGNDMGTTITLALVAGDRAIVGNVGDSRTYLYRGGALKRISKDHSLVMRLVELGQITEDEIYTHPQRNAVLRSLGDRSELEVDVFSLRLRPGDALLLCCDGQWEMTRDPQMAEILAANDDPQAAVAALIAAANQAGGEDNITSVLVKFETYGE